MVIRLSDNRMLKAPVDAEGRFEFRGLTDEPWRIEASARGLEDEYVGASVARPGEKTQIGLSLRGR